MLFDESIYPYKGMSSVLLYMNIKDVEEILDKNSVSYRVDTWESDSETIPNPWKAIIVDNTVSFFFAKNDKLFKIVFWKGYKGKLSNGISTGMKIEDAQAIDNTLTFDEWNEDYESQSGYWLEDELETQQVLSISIFIKEMLDENLFDYCNW